MRLVLKTSARSGLQVGGKNLYFVDKKNFVWHISYAGNFDYEAELGPQDHDNYSCSCVPHDMEIRMPVSLESRVVEVRRDTVLINGNLL